MSVYLDSASTSLPDPEITEKIYLKSLECFGNPSSLHAEGIKAGSVLEESRKRCARSLDVSPGKIIFTSGGTESNNTALFSILIKMKKGTVITTGIEHPSVTQPCAALKESGCRLIKVDPCKNGIINPSDIEKNLSEDISIVSVMHVNNETGAIQPIKEIAELIRCFNQKNNSRILFHCDAVQGAGKIRLDIEKSGIDLLSISSHKISGPKGTGLLYLRNSIMPFITGGGQEYGIRSGTENLPHIYGFSLAMEKAYSNIDSNFVHADKLLKLLLENFKNVNHLIKIIPAERSSSPELYSPYILNIAAGKIPAEVTARVMSDKGYYISAGSACSSLKKKTSNTLSSMKLDNRTAFSSVRISTGYTTTEGDIKSFCKAFIKEITALADIYR